ncbi:alpha/beta fold hydrolase [Sphaerimonospora cavernae]|uniref:Alpha/beta fold hydrolase n=1 Tax=Sphaerimonospora cavernae TaxID=1740611 RepID=A0ABV6U1L8_9ACTN
MYFTAQDGVRLHFDDRGSGEPVVMIHGAAGSGMSFDALAEHLRRDFRVVTVDLRGLSRSDRVETIGATAWCDDTVGIADFLGLDTFHLVGCSLGARIAGRIARDNADRVKSLSVDAPLLSVTRDGGSSLNRRFEDLDHAAPEDLEKWQRYHGDDWRGAVSFYGRVRNDPGLQTHLTIRPWLPELTLPTLITRGCIDDSVHPLAHCIEWHSAHPASWLWIAPGTRFSLTQRLPAEFADIYRRFVAEATR